RSLAEQEIVAGDVLLDDYERPRLRHMAAGDVMAAARLLLETRRVIATSAAIELDGCKGMEPPRGEPLLESTTGGRRRSETREALALDMTCRPALSSRDYGKWLTVQTQAPAQRGLVWVDVRSQAKPSDLSAKVVRLFVNDPQPGDSYLDWLTYRGMRLHVTPSPNANAEWFQISAPPEESSAAFELALRFALAARSEGETIIVRVAGASDESMIFSLAAEAWRPQR
ncbi:MAG: hypothetical protein HZB38_18020, partial [Planctomycetes bacterium]|nr:hypothetical protein [Planctomycetota bacterium]